MGILENEIYKGDFVHGKRTKHPTYYENVVEPIISKEMWSDCQVQKKKNSRSYQRTLTYLYLQKLRCPKCGRILGRKSTTKKNGNAYFNQFISELVEYDSVVNQINFRESICKPCQELYDNGYIDTTKPMILGNVLGSVRFSNYLPEEEVGEIIMRLRQYYDVHYTEATYYVDKQMFYFNFAEDNSAIVRVFPLEDYYKLNLDNKMETYKFGIFYINEEDKFQMKEIDTAFDYIPDENKKPKNKKKNNDTRF